MRHSSRGCSGNVAEPVGTGVPRRRAPRGGARTARRGAPAGRVRRWMAARGRVPVPRGGVSKDYPEVPVKCPGTASLPAPMGRMGAPRAVASLWTTPDPRVHEIKKQDARKRRPTKGGVQQKTRLSGAVAIPYSTPVCVIRQAVAATPRSSARSRSAAGGNPRVHAVRGPDGGCGSPDFSRERRSENARENDRRRDASKERRGTTGRTQKGAAPEGGAPVCTGCVFSCSSAVLGLLQRRTVSRSWYGVAS